MQSQPARRLPVRAENQDGPWTVSVAETPHEANSYSIYIKSECLSSLARTNSPHPSPHLPLRYVVAHALALTSSVYMLTPCPFYSAYT